MYGQDESLPRFRLVTSGGAGAAANLEQTASAAKIYVITGFSVSVLAAATTNDVTIELKDGGSGGTVIWRDVLGAAAARGAKASQFFPHGLPCAKGAAARLEASAPGGTTVLALNLHGYTIERKGPTA